MVQELDERHEEDDGRNDASEEPWLLRHSRVSQKGDTVIGKSEEQTSELGNEVEDVETNASSQDE